MSGDVCTADVARAGSRPRAHRHARRRARLQLSIERGELNTGLGTQQREFGIQRRIQVLYLDDTLRIARFLPDEDLPVRGFFHAVRAARGV